MKPPIAMPKLKMPSVGKAGKPGIPMPKPPSASKAPSVKVPQKGPTMQIEPADNGGFVTRTTASRKPGSAGGAWEQRQELIGQHANLAQLKAHITSTYPQAKPAIAKAPAPAWAGVAAKMLAK